jgi:hypothetical protein
MNLDPDATDVPDVLTVEEAAAILRIGRSSAYSLARRYRATGGQEGLPVIALGRHLRVPRTGLRRLIDAEAEAKRNEDDPIRFRRPHAS